MGQYWVVNGVESRLALPYKCVSAPDTGGPWYTRRSFLIPVTGLLPSVAYLSKCGSFLPRFGTTVLLRIWLCTFGLRNIIYSNRMRNNCDDVLHVER